MGRFLGKCLQQFLGTVGHRIHGGGPKASVAGNALGGREGFYDGGGPKASVAATALCGHHEICYGGGPEASVAGTALGGPHVSNKASVH